MKQIFTKLSIVSLFLCLLCACGNKSVSDSTIIADVENDYKTYIMDIVLDSAEASIDKRQTNEKTDYVWGHVIGTGGVRILEADYCAEYTLYNDGWELSSVEYTNLTYGLSEEGPDDKKMTSALQEACEAEYAEYVAQGVTISEIIVDNNYCDTYLAGCYVDFSFKLSREEGYCWATGTATFLHDGAEWYVSYWEPVSSSMPVATSFPYDDNHAYGILEASGEEYDTYELLESEIDLEAARATYYYQLYNNKGYISSSETVEVNYYFDIFNGWEGGYGYNSIYGESTEEWNVLGEWTYEDSYSSVLLNILNIEDNVITYECKLSYDADRSVLKNHLYKDEEAQTAHLSSLEDEIGLEFTLPTYDPTFTNTLNSLTVCIYPYKEIRIEYYGEELFVLADSNTERFTAVQGEPEYVEPQQRLLYDENIVASVENASFSSFDLDYGEHNYSDNISYTKRDEDDDNAEIIYNLYGKYSRLSGTVFLKDNAEPGEHATVKIYGDGKLLYNFDAISFSKSNCCEEFEVDVSGVCELKLVFDGGHYKYQEFLAGLVRVPLVTVSGLMAEK